MKKAAGFALIKTIPVFLGYIFLGIAFGLLLQKAGLGAGWAFLISLFVYAGSMQFALVGILTEGLSFAATAIMTLLINSRHAFYGLTFIERFRKMKAAGPYMIFSLTDETYSILCSAKKPDNFTDREWKLSSLFISLFNHCYWVAGSVAGALIGQFLPFDTTGIDFAMTALFIVICVNQWRETSCHLPAKTGFFCGMLCLALFGPSGFILPALIAVSALLLIFRHTIQRNMEDFS